METKFNFKSQVCTSREQSERLLALGLKKETADMCWQTTTLNGEPITYPSQDVWLNGSIITNNHFPAWSLGRLIEILPSTIKLKEGLPTFCPFATLDLSPVAVSYTWIDFDAEDRNLAGFYGNGLFAAVVDAVEWLIKEGYFNKEYLEE